MNVRYYLSPGRHPRAVETDEAAVAEAEAVMAGQPEGTSMIVYDIGGSRIIAFVNATVDGVRVNRIL